MKESGEKVILIGDIRGVNLRHLTNFVETAGFALGGSYPVEPIGVRASLIVAGCQRLRDEGAEQFLVVESDPPALVEAIRLVKNGADLSGMTVIGLDAPFASDRIDAATRIRIVSLPPTPCPFPTHPTPNA